MEDLTDEFLAESKEGLDRVERCLTALETNPEDTELVSEIFRAVHTIKGATGFLGFTRLEKVTHAGESLLGKLRDKQVQVSDDLISGLLELMDALRRILALIEMTGREGARAEDEDSALIERLRRLAEPGGAEEALTALPAATVEATVSDAYEAEGDGWDQPAMPGGSAAPAPVEVSQEVARSAAIETVGGVEKTLRVDVDVLNRMMNLVGELVLTRNQILQSSLGEAQFAQLGRRLDSVTAELRETVMEARMQPVGNLFHKFPRMVRDLAKTCGKKVRIELAGLETGLDRSLLEAIRDPLTHAVRNSVDHGIEAPETRLRQGKQAEGVVRLRAFQQGGLVVVELLDDGAGVPIEQARARAVERGLVPAARAAAMTEREVVELLFLPGFSTAAKVTHVSGRGVGLDVVRSNLEKVGGSVELESRAGCGTTMRLKVPLTTAIVPALVVRSGGQSFALPQSALVELVYVARDEVSEAVERMGEAELYRLRDRLLPMVRLDRLLELCPEPGAEGGPFYLAVLEVDGARFGLVLDDLLAPEEIVVKPLSMALRELGVFSGATVLGNGSLALILDVPATAARAKVGTVIEEAVRTHGREAVLAMKAEQRFLVFVNEGGREQGGMAASRKRERMAIPLERVERIESVAVGRIEYVGGRPLLQYRGETLPLEDVASLLDGALETETGLERKVTVLICMSGAAGPSGPSRVGVVVYQVLHVTSGTPLASSAGPDARPRMALVDGRVTMVYDAFEAVRGLTATAQMSLADGRELVQ